MKPRQAHVVFVFVSAFYKCALVLSKMVAWRFRTTCAAGLVLMLPAVGQAQLTYTTNNGTITITGYTGSASTMTIPSTVNGYPVTRIGENAFAYRTSLTGVYFWGNAPSVATGAFQGDYNTTVYYLPGTTGWSGFVAFYGVAIWQRVPVVLWNPQAQATNGTFGVRSNRFGFTITGTTNIPVVVEGCTSLASASWTALKSCTITNGSIYFSDAEWTNYVCRFYRIRSP